MSKEYVRIFRALLAYSAPHPQTVHGHQCRAYDIDTVGDPYLTDYKSARTKNGSFSRAIVESDFGDLRIWWSYSTPIAIQHMGTRVALVSSYGYSNTTNKHQNAVRLHGHEDTTLRYYGHVGDRTTPEEVLKSYMGWLHQRKLAVARARERADWRAKEVVTCLDKLRQLCRQLDLHADIPQLAAGISEKAQAKLYGTALNEPALAHMIMEYSHAREVLRGKERATNDLC